MSPFISSQGPTSSVLALALSFDKNYQEPTMWEQII